MAPSRIVIIDEEPGQQLGAQLRAILQRERHCAVDLIESPLLEGAGVTSPSLDLIIPVLPSSKQSATQLLATLLAKESGTPLLPLMRAADRSRPLGKPFRRTHDCLVTPLRAAEGRNISFGARLAF